MAAQDGHHCIGHISCVLVHEIPAPFIVLYVVSGFISVLDEMLAIHGCGNVSLSQNMEGHLPSIPYLTTRVPSLPPESIVTNNLSISFRFTLKTASLKLSAKFLITFYFFPESYFICIL